MIKGEEYHNFLNKKGGKYWNEYKGIWCSKKSSELLKNSKVKIYEFIKYNVECVKSDFEYKYWEKVCMFLSELYRMQYGGYKFDDGETVYWSAEKLKVFLGVDYIILLDRLIELNIVKVLKGKNRFSTEANCRYIILNKRITNVEGEPYIERNLISSVYERSILNYYKKCVNSRKRGFKYLEGVMDRVKFDINKNIDEVNTEIYDEKLVSIKNSIDSDYISGRKRNKLIKVIENEGKYKEEYLSDLGRYYCLVNNKLNSITDVRRYYYNINVDKFGYRISHFFSNMPKKYRRYLTIDDEEVIELDIVSSHPAFLSILMTKWFVTGDQVLVNSDTPYRFLDYLEMIYNKKNIKQKIDLYKFMSFKIYGFAGLRSVAKRNEMKSLFRGLLNGDPNIEKYKGRNRKELIVKLFGIEFYDFLIKLSKVDVEGIKNKKYRNLSALLQREESAFLNNVMSELLKLDIPYLPLYDSLIVKKSDRKLVLDAYSKVINDSGYNGIIAING
jgi:hypothetical protein